jgi:hypothetical protein
LRRSSSGSISRRGPASFAITRQRLSLPPIRLGKGPRADGSRPHQARRSYWNGPETFGFGVTTQEANHAYQRLLQEYPGSAEARVALVSRGELQLAQLADASAALGSFDTYLRGGGALRQEASYGRIRALRRLGRLREAEAATRAFLSAYPRSVQAATLRKEIP